MDFGEAHVDFDLELLRAHLPGRRSEVSYDGHFPTRLAGRTPVHRRIKYPLLSAEFEFLSFVPVGDEFLSGKANLLLLPLFPPSVGVREFRVFRGRL